MTINRKANRRGYGLINPIPKLNPLPIIAQRAPVAGDWAEIGTMWLDQAGNDIYVLLEIIASVATWVPIGAGAGVFDSVTSTTFVHAGTEITAATGLTVTAGLLTLGAMAATGVLTNTAAGVVTSNAMANGTLLIGSTGLAPVVATLTAGAGIGIVEGAGTITISAPGGTAVQYTTDDANTPVPDGFGNVNVLGVVGGNITTTGAIANTISIDVIAAPVFTGLVTANTGITQVAGTTTITSDTNAARAIYLHANGGVNETIELYSQLGTGVDANASVNLYSLVGGVRLSSGIAAANAVRIAATDAAGGIDVDAGTAGFILDSTGAVSLDSAAASNFTVTGAFDLSAISTLGSVVINGGEAVADAIQLIASNAAGGVTGAVGTGGYILGATNGAFTVNTGTGNINLGTDAAAKNISIGNGTGATAIDIDAGTGACTILSNATDHSITFGSVTGVSALTTQTGTGAMTFDALGVCDINAVGAITLDSSAGTIGIGVNADAFAINIGIGAAARVITVGNVTGATGVAVNTGTAGLVATITDGPFTVTTGTGQVDISADATANTINIGTGAGIKTLTMGSGNTTSITAIDCGTAGLTLGTTANAHTTTVGSATGVASIVCDCGTGAADFGANATVHTTTVGSVTGASATNIYSGSGNVTLASAVTPGLITVTPGTDTQAAAAITIDAYVGAGTFTGLVTAAAATQDLTITNALVSATSHILCSVANLGANDAQINIRRITPAAGSFVVKVVNDGAAPLNGNIHIAFWVLD